jgi:L-2-hydroxyglutarate oxidase LhgO
LSPAGQKDDKDNAIEVIPVVSGHSTDAVVIGAGVVGLAIARALAQAGRETVLLERRSHIGEETSSRNSGVVHAGIYYPPGSVKAATCVRGRQLLYEFLASHQVPHRRCGKLVVARSAGERRALQSIRDRAARCGVDDLDLIDGAGIRALEPEVEGECALLSPSTGIVDPHQLMLALQGDFEAAGGMVAVASPVEAGKVFLDRPHRIRVGGEFPTELSCRVLVNATGLHARRTWDSLVNGDARQAAPDQFYAKGHYYSYAGAAPFSRLVYPLPEAGGLGVHATLDLGGQVRFGPDVRWVEGIDHAFDDSGREDFVNAIRRYFPGLEPARLQPGYTGIRPKVVGPGDAAGDFILLSERQHGIPGLLSLHGIESPGLTACLALAESAVGLLAG